uniref:Protein ELC n=1 Tax=Noccaea caerulescens TaxID=107243 RepID=A0A1J3CYL6_NOCCA
MSAQPSNPQRKANDPSPLSNPRRKAYDVLSGLLSDPGLTYSDFTKGFIMRHLVDVVSSGILLQYKIEANLLQAYGSIPYREIYSVHVTICFTQFYPHHCPGVRVNCTDDTIIVGNSNFVDSSGAISHTYLDSWNHLESNVVSLVRILSQEFTKQPPLAIPDLSGVLTPDQTKLAKILIENGGKELYHSFISLDRKDQADIFKEITKKYRRHPDLPTYIKTKERGVEAFIKKVQHVASEYVTVPSSSSSALGTHGSHQAGQMSPLHSAPVPPENLMLNPQVETEISNLFMQKPTYSDARKELIQEHLRNLHRYYPEKVSVKHDLSKPYIQIVVKIPYCFQGYSKFFAPVTISLPMYYPDSRPHIGLDCPEDSVISKNLLSVGPGGIVFFSYLRTWDKVKSNLLGLVSYLSAEFTCESPLVHIGSQ